MIFRNVVSLHIKLYFLILDIYKLFQVSKVLLFCSIMLLVEIEDVILSVDQFKIERNEFTRCTLYIPIQINGWGH